MTFGEGNKNYYYCDFHRRNLAKEDDTKTVKRRYTSWVNLTFDYKIEYTRKYCFNKISRRICLAIKQLFIK